MENDNIYDYFDDGNIRIESNSCCSPSCNSKLNSILKDAPKEMDSFKEVYDEFKKVNGNFNSSNDKFGNDLGKLQGNIDDITKAIDDMKNSCFHSEHHHFDKVIASLKDLKFELNCEFAKRAHDMLKMEERIKRLEVDLKYLDLLRLTKIEKALKELVENQQIVTNVVDKNEAKEEEVENVLDGKIDSIYPEDSVNEQPEPVEEPETIEELFAKLED